MPRLGLREWLAVGAVMAHGDILRTTSKRGVTRRFEADMARSMGTRHCITMSSGTAALVCGLQALGVGPGDEVLVSAYTWMASAAAVLQVGAVPVLVEIDETLTMDPADLEAKITPRSKAVMPVHMLNRPCAMDRIMAIARRHGLRVIEDASQAVGIRYATGAAGGSVATADAGSRADAGARDGPTGAAGGSVEGRRPLDGRARGALDGRAFGTLDGRACGTLDGRACGAIGDLGVFSFNQFKNMTCGEGGALLTADDALRDRAYCAHDVGVSFRDLDDRRAAAAFVGSNYRVSEIEGAILGVQLQRLPRRLARVARRAAIIEAILRDAGLPVAPNAAPGTVMGPVVTFDTEAQATAFAQNRGVWRLHDRSKHVYTHWTAILERRMAHPGFDPWRWAGHDDADGSMNCPRTLDLLRRSCAISPGAHLPVPVVKAAARRLARAG